MTDGLRAVKYPGKVHVADLPRACGPSLDGRYWEPVRHVYHESTRRTTILFRPIPMED